MLSKYFLKKEFEFLGKNLCFLKILLNQ
jgi:hypothetical protein